MPKMDEKLEKALLDEGITRQAVEEVLETGRATGALFRDEATGRLSTCAQLENLTLWVVFREDGTDVEVLDAYYHRMQVS